MEILVIGSCTSDKDDHGCPPELMLIEEDFDERHRLSAKERQVAAWIRPAARMYTGKQHTQMMAGVDVMRAKFGPDSCAVKIISAGYGLVEENQPIAPYDVTFAGRSRPYINNRGYRLHIPERIREAIAVCPVVIFLLGEKYLHSVQPPVEQKPHQRFIFFGGKRNPKLHGQRSVVIGAAQREATHFGDGVITLKGRMFYLLAVGLTKNPSAWEELITDDTPATALALMQGSMGRA